ncbi:hypothetical protein J1614_004424 [Plenodomus biglobosus]|nr:hypothetical protein J1614_004424 [Plenodomus biglobosus]
MLASILGKVGGVLARTERQREQCTYILGLSARNLKGCKPQAGRESEIRGTTLAFDLDLATWSGIYGAAEPFGRWCCLKGPAPGLLRVEARQQIASSLEVG